MITRLEFSVSPGLAGELEALEGGEAITSQAFEARYASFPTIESFLLEKLKGREAEAVGGLEALGEGLDVLDIGVGEGVSSFDLARRGHRVSAVEPSSKHCRLIDHGAARYGLAIKVYQATAEAIDQIPDLFDVAVFNSSLHHCDDPLRALRNCFQKLRAGGWLIVANEPLLKFYRSKERHHARLKADPAEMGHYGGNEHIYTWRQYRDLILRAGFSRVIDEPHPMYGDLRSIARLYRHRERKLDRLARSLGVKRRPALERRLQFGLKVGANCLLALVYRLPVLRPLLYPPLKKLSLFRLTFRARKAGPQSSSGSEVRNSAYTG